MDAVIEYDKAAGFLKNPPSLEPRPNFNNIRALQKHIVQAFAQLLCPQSTIHGWSGLAMDPTSYLLSEGAAFTIPLNPGPTAIFPGGNAVARTFIRTTQATFDHAKNYLSGITAISAEVAAAINQLSANQLAIMSQMAATNAQMAPLSVVPPQAKHTRAFAPREQFHVLPIQQVAVPMQQPFLGVGVYPSGRGGQRAWRGCGCGGRRSGSSRTPFADAMHGAETAQPIAAMVPYGGGITQPLTGMQQQQRRNPDFSNTYKVHNNWNVCFRCSFDIEDGHTCITCPFKWWNHQDSFTRKNA
jgi:hypothetical protein